MLKPLLSLILSMIVGKLKSLLLTNIENLNSGSLTNDEKRKEAFNAFKRDATKSGRELRDSLINLAIELAVSYLKK